MRYLRLSRPALVIAVAALAAAAGFTMDWPTSNGKTAANFGADAGCGTPLTGDVVSAEGDVYSADPGDVLMTVSADDTQNFVPPLGNWVAIDHGGGMVSVYTRLGTVAAVNDRVEKGVTIAAAGQSGWTARDGFELSFFDRHERQWVNPLRILNTLPDTVPPSIHTVKLKNSAGQFIDLAQTRTLRQGHYTVSVYASDRAESAEGSLMPFSIICLLNGVEAGRLELETFNARDGVLLINRNGSVPARQVYANYPALEAANEVLFTRGQANLDVSVQDFAGNIRKALYHLYVE